MNKSAKRKLWIVVITLGTIFIVGISTLVYTMIDDDQTSSKTPLLEYVNLFTKEAQRNLQILATVKGRNREPTSTYIYNDGKYNILVLKVILTDNLSLKKIVNYKIGTSYSNIFVVNAGLPSFNFDMKINERRIDAVSTVCLKTDGDYIKSIVNNDSLRCYYYNFKTFSISYNNGFYDILSKADESDIPASVIFKKRGKLLYIILMTIAKGKEEMQPGLLYSLINK